MLAFFLDCRDASRRTLGTESTAPRFTFPDLIAIDGFPRPMGFDNLSDCSGIILVRAAKRVSHMKQAIAGVSPAETEETTVMVVWPSIACFKLGRLLGAAFSWRWPNVHIFRIGNLIALASAPIALGLYFFRLHPCIYGATPYGVTYCLTNRRLQVRRHELHMNWERILWGVGLAIAFAIAGGTLLPIFAAIAMSLFALAGGWTFEGSTLATVGAIATGLGALGGAVKGFVLGTARVLFDQEVKSVHLDRFDTIDIETQPGQAWYHAADLVFRDGNVETFRLVAVSRPETFRATCLKSRAAYVGVKAARERELANA